jgi:hypothetical protein
MAPLHFWRPDTFDVTALLCSSTLIDLELLYRFLIGEPMKHGLWHSYLFVLTIYPVVLSLIVYVMEHPFGRVLSKVHRVFRFFPKRVRYPWKTIYFSCLVGGISHIFFDMWTHENSSYILFPFTDANPFWLGQWGVIIHGVVILLSIYTVLCWITRARNRSSPHAASPTGCIF